MEAVFLRIVNIAITASWLVLAVFLLRFALKKAPKWATCLLWGVVALRLILPFSLESALSLIPSSEPIFEQSVVTEAPSAQPTLPDENQSSTPSVNEKPNSSGNQVIAPPSSGSLAPTPEASVDPMQIVLFVASLVWLCGVLAMLGYGAYSYWRLRRKLRASIRKEGRVYLCDNVETPFILGVFRPRIYLPSGIGAGEIPYVIAHEEAHLKRKDHLWKPLGFLLLSVYWFNPLFWMAYILLCRDIENACDEKVIKNCDNAYRVGYSEALLSCSIHRRSVMACPVAFGETGVKSRIRAVLHYKKPAFWVILVAIVAIIVTCVCFLTDPVRDKDETTTAGTTEDVPVTTATPTTTTTTTTTTTPTTPEDPDAWKEKVEWGAANTYPADAYDGETGKYNIQIFIQDVHNVGQTNAEKAFAERFDLFYNPDYDLWQILGFRFVVQASKEEIEMYAKLDEVKAIWFNLKAHNDPITPVESMWWQQIESMQGITRVTKADGSTRSRFTLIVKRESGLFPILSDGRSALKDVDFANARVLIKDMNHDNNYTEYKVESWYFYNNYQFHFEVEGFVAEEDIKYDMYLVFTLPEGTPYPGETAYIWALGEPWTLVPLPTTPPDHFLAGDMEVSWWQALKRIDGITAFENADGSTRYTFGLTVDKEANDFFPDDSFAEISAEGAYVYIQKLNYETKHTKYQVKSLTATAEGRLEFEVLGFVPEQDARYDVFLFYIMPEGSLYPGEKGYVWTVGDAWVLQ